MLHLKKSGPVLVSELRELFKNPLALAKALQKRGLVVLKNAKVERKPFALDLPPASAGAPQPGPENCAQGNCAGNRRRPERGLLPGRSHGQRQDRGIYPGSKAALSRGKRALIMVPEIALTPQLMHRFRTRFPDEKIAMLHSGLSPSERFDQLVANPKGRGLARGGRALRDFCAAGKPGGWWWWTRNRIRLTSRKAGSITRAATSRFGGAERKRRLWSWRVTTFPLQSAYNAEQGKYKLIELPERIDFLPLPSIELVDMRKEMEAEQQAPVEQPGRRPELPPDKQISALQMITTPLSEGLRGKLSGRGNQSIIFLNRRGFRALAHLRGLRPPLHLLLTVQSRSPGTSANRARNRRPGTGSRKAIPICSATIAGIMAPAPEYCPKCLSVKVKEFGVGTERVEEELTKRIFAPGADRAHGPRHHGEPPRLF